MALVPDSGCGDLDRPKHDPTACEATDLRSQGETDTKCPNGELTDGPDERETETQMSLQRESPADLMEHSSDGSPNREVVIEEGEPSGTAQKHGGADESPCVIDNQDSNEINKIKDVPCKYPVMKGCLNASEKETNKESASPNPVESEEEKRSVAVQDSQSETGTSPKDKKNVSGTSDDKSTGASESAAKPPKIATPLRAVTRNRMPKSCCVPGCKSRRGRSPDWVKFYRLPQNDVRFQQWLEAIPRDWYGQFENPLRDINRGNFTVCSMHFEGGLKSDYVDDTAYVPTLFDENIRTKRPSAEPDISIVQKSQPAAPKTKASKIPASMQTQMNVLHVEPVRNKATTVTVPSEPKQEAANVFVIQPHQVTPVVLAPEHRRMVSTLLPPSIPPPPPLRKKRPKDSRPSVIYNLNWPGFGFMPMYIVDKQNKELYHEGHPLPQEKLRLDSFQNKYVAVDDVLSCFEGKSLAMATKQLILLTENIETTASYRHDATREYFIHLNTLLAFIIIAPYCVEFQCARSAILTHLMDYAEMPCLKCGFVQRDCCCNMQPSMLVKHHGPTELIAKVTDLTENSTQTDVVSCPICKDPQAFKTAKNPMLVMPPGLKLNPGEKFSLTMQQNSSGAVQIRAGMCPDDSNLDPMLPPLPMGMSGSPGGMMPLHMLPPGPPMSSSPSAVHPPCSMATSLPNFPTSMPPPFHPSNMPFSMPPPSSLPPASFNLPGMVPWMPPHTAGSHQPMMWPPLPPSMEGTRNMPPGGFSFPGMVLPPSQNPPHRLPALRPLTADVIAKQAKNQPQYVTSKPIVLRDPKEILREEDIRRKKRRMDKLFDDKFQLAKPPSEDTDKTTGQEDEKTEEKSPKEAIEKSKEEARPLEENKKDMSSDKGSDQPSVDKEENLDTKDLKETDLLPDKEGEVAQVADKCDDDAEKETVDETDDKSQELKSRETDLAPDEKGGPRAEAGDLEEQTSKEASISDSGSNLTKDTALNETVAETEEQAESAVDVNEDSAVAKLTTDVMGGALDMLASVAEVLNAKMDTSPTENQTKAKHETDLNDNASTRPGSPSSEHPMDGMEPGPDSAETHSLMSENSFLSELSRDIELASGKSLADITLEPSPKKNEYNDRDSTLVNKESPVADKEAVSGIEATPASAPATPCTPATPSTPATSSTPVEGSPLPVVLPDLTPEAIEKGFADFEYVPTGERMIRCVLFGCGQCFDTEDCARLHVKCHEPRGKGLVCFVCKDFTVQSIKWYNMERHLQEKHGHGIPASDLHCKFCGLLFDSAEELEKHGVFHYYSEYKCIHCSQHCFTWKHMQHHLTSCNDVSKQYYYNCPFCHLVFHTAPIQQMHINSHTDKGFVCCICKDDTVWETWKKLKTHYYKFHLSRDQKKFVKCTKCRRTFATMVTYNTHIEKYHAGKKKNESVGDEDFEPSAKKRKMSVSSETAEGKPDEKEGVNDKDDEETKVDELPDDQSENEEEKKEEDQPPPEFECEKCGKKFREQRRLDLHLENAHGEVQCDQCDHVAKNKYLLKSHKAQRHAEKQHTCTECGRAFARFFQLKIHLAAHARKAMYPCKTCKAEFHNHREMRQHYNQAHAANNTDRSQLTCSNCDFSCYSRTTMKLHLRKKHQEENEAEEEDSVDHSYFTKNMMMAPPPPPPPPAARRSKKESALSLPRGRGRGRGRGGKRGRGRSAKYLAREESKRKEQVKTDNMLRKKIKRLRKNTCSRTRSLDENRLIKLDDAKNGEQNMTIDEERDPFAESASSADPFSDLDRSGPLSPQYAANAPWDSPPSQTPPVSPKYSYSSRGRRRTISRPRSPYDTLEWGKSKSHEEMLSPEPGPSTLDTGFGFPLLADVVVQPLPPPPPPPEPEPEPPLQAYMVHTTAGVVDLRVIEMDHCYCLAEGQTALPIMGLPDDGIDIMDTLDDVGPIGLGIPEQHALKPSIYSSMTGAEALFLPPQKTVLTRAQPDLIPADLGSSSSTVVNPDFRGMKATISSGLGTKRIIPTTSTPNIIGIHKLSSNNPIPSIVSIRKVITAKDLEGHKRVIVKSLPHPHEKVTVRSIAELPSVLPETIPSVNQFQLQNSAADLNFAQSVNLSKFVAALSEGEQSDLPVVPDDDPNMSGGSNISLPDLDSNLLMPEADMQDILQAAAQVLQDQEIMDSVDNIPHT